MAKEQGAVSRAKTRTSTRTKTRNARDYQESKNPVWFLPVMLGFMIVGLFWVIVYYISEQKLPIESIGAWNIPLGFGIMFIGFLMTTRWK